MLVTDFDLIFENDIFGDFPANKNSSDGDLTHYIAFSVWKSDKTILNGSPTCWVYRYNVSILSFNLVFENYDFGGFPANSSQ